FDAPKLYRLPIQQRCGCEYKTGYHSSDHAGTAQNQGYQGSVGLTESVAERCKINPGPQPGHGCLRKIMIAVGPADVAEARADNKIGAAFLAYLFSCLHRLRSILGYSRFPELLPLLVVGCQMCHVGRPSCLIL